MNKTFLFSIMCGFGLNVLIYAYLVSNRIVAYITFISTFKWIIAVSYKMYTEEVDSQKL